MLDTESIGASSPFQAMDEDAFLTKQRYLIRLLADWLGLFDLARDTSLLPPLLLVPVPSLESNPTGSGP